MTFPQLPETNTAFLQLHKPKTNFEQLPKQTLSSYSFPIPRLPSYSYLQLWKPNTTCQHYLPTPSHSAPSLKPQNTFVNK